MAKVSGRSSRSAAPSAARPAGSAAARRPAGNGAGKTTRATASSTVDESQMTEAQLIRHLAKKVSAGVSKHFGITLARREERQKVKVGHAFREMVGLDVNAKLLKAGKKALDWKKFNKLFAAVFGEPDQAKYSPAVTAAVAAIFYEWVSQDSDEAISQLVEYNRESLKRRNERDKAEEEEIEVAIDDEVDDELGDEVEEDDIVALDDDEADDEEYEEFDDDE